MQTSKSTIHECSHKHRCVDNHTQAWGRESGGADAGIMFLADSNAELTKALGLVMETPMMPRTKRFSLIAEDGVVTHYFSSAEESSNTWAPAVLAKM